MNSDGGTRDPCELYRSRTETRELLRRNDQSGQTRSKFPSTPQQFRSTLTSNDERLRVPSVRFGEVETVRE